MSGERVLIATFTRAAGDGSAEAAAIAVAASLETRRDGALVIDLGDRAGWRDTILATAAARRVAARPSWAACGARAFARGRLAIVAAGAEGDPGALLDESQGCGLPRCLLAPPELFWGALEIVPAGGAATLVRTTPADRDLAGALAIEMRRRRIPVRIWPRGLGAIGARRARAGLDPGGEPRRRAVTTFHRLFDESPPRAPRSAALGAQPPRAEAGQALPAALGILVAAAIVGLALVALGGAATAKGRAQRAVDLAALSAARSMRDDFGRLFVPLRGADGTPNPRHLGLDRYLGRAVDAARQVAARNGLAPDAIRVRFIDRRSIAPLSVQVRARPRIEIAGVRQAARTNLSATATAEPTAGASAGLPPERGSGGGYAGPLAYRQGRPMRPDVARAFDRLAAAAGGAGLPLTINSAFRSDAEQAALFAANPDPRWVAPPGKSLHRCGTELDLGPSGTHAWLAANAGRFGFVRRYSWEPWHFGFARGPEPCSLEGEGVGPTADRPRDGAAAGAQGLPAYVPAFARAALLTAAARHDVSAQLLAAQLMAESNFNPAAVSVAGARGIAQFMPATAAAYGLDDPFDPAAAIDAQARLMADLLEQFGSTGLALAAYNAGPGAVAACSCIPAYPETQAYVARILAMLEGAGAAPAGAASALEVRLVA